MRVLQRPGDREDRGIRNTLWNTGLGSTCSFRRLHNAEAHDRKHRGSGLPQWGVPLCSLPKISHTPLFSGHNKYLYSLLCEAVSHRNTTCLPPHPSPPTSDICRGDKRKLYPFCKYFKFINTGNTK